MDKQQLDTIKSWLGAGAINIFGRPFAGKDTQAKRLGELLDAPVIAGGDILRSHHDQTTVKRLMSTGELFPTDYYFSIILPYLSQPELEGRPLVLSSVGRWHGEEPTILDAATKAGHPMAAVVFLDLDEDEVLRRFKAAAEQNDRGHRHDDAEHVLQVRLKEFREKTMPVIDFYRDKNLLLEVDGNQRPDAVTDGIIRSLKRLADA